MSSIVAAAPAVKRRTIVKGMAWAAPVVMAAGVAPAFAASGEPVEPMLSAVVCGLEYGSATPFVPYQPSYQQMGMSLGVVTTTGEIAAGTQFVYRISINYDDNTIIPMPLVQPDQGVEWSVDLSRDPAYPWQLTLILTFHADVVATGRQCGYSVFCGPTLVWDNEPERMLPGGAYMSIETDFTQIDWDRYGAETSSLSFGLATRSGLTEENGEVFNDNAAHWYSERRGGQDFWPPITYIRDATSNDDTLPCEEYGGNGTVTLYPETPGGATCRSVAFDTPTATIDHCGPPNEDVQIS